MQTSIEHAIDHMVAAWNSGDAGAYADLFTEDATYVIFTGAVSDGRTAIRRDHIPVLTKWQKGSRMRVAIKSVRRLDADTAIVVTEGGVSKSSTIRLNKAQTFVFRRQESGEWLCAAFHNTKKNRLLNWIADRAVTKGS